MSIISTYQDINGERANWTGIHGCTLHTGKYPHCSETRKCGIRGNVE